MMRSAPMSTARPRRGAFIVAKLNITSDPEAAFIPSDLFGRAATERS